MDLNSERGLRDIHFLQGLGATGTRFNKFWPRGWPIWDIWVISEICGASACPKGEIWGYLFSCDQAALWMAQSVRLSVRLYVCLYICDTFCTMFPSSYHHKICWSYYQWQKWCPCKRSRSKVKVTEVTTQLHRFRTVTPVWIKKWCIKLDVA